MNTTLEWALFGLTCGAISVLVVFSCVVLLLYYWE